MSHWPWLFVWKCHLYSPVAASSATSELENRLVPGRPEASCDEPQLRALPNATKIRLISGSIAPWIHGEAPAVSAQVFCGVPAGQGVLPSVAHIQLSPAYQVLPLTSVTVVPGLAPP